MKQTPKIGDELECVIWGQGTLPLGRTQGSEGLGLSATHTGQRPGYFQQGAVEGQINVIFPGGKGFRNPQISRSPQDSQASLRWFSATLEEERAVNPNTPSPPPRGCEANLSGTGPEGEP